MRGSGWRPCPSADIAADGSTATTLIAVGGQPSGVESGASANIEDQYGSVRKHAQQPVVDLLESHAFVPDRDGRCVVFVPSY